MSAAPSRSTAPQRPHTPWIDYAKGIGIILVVVGHTLRGLQRTPVNVPGWETVDSWIYAFHMPLFFFLAGLFVERSCRQPLGRFISGKAGRIVWPYFVWSILQELFRRAGARSSHDLSDLWTIIYRPVMQFWFLYVLFMLLVLYAVWRKAGAPWQAFVAVAFALNISLAFGVNYGPWGIIYQMWINIPYFALGVLVTGYAARLPQAGSWTVPALIAASAGGYLAIAVAVGLHLTGRPLLLVPLATVGIAASAALSVFLSRTAHFSWVEFIGLRSMEIFVAHTIFSSSLRQALLAAGIQNPAVHVAGGILVGLAGPMLLYAACKRWNLLVLFQSPLPRHG